jgi:hypothetical protein
LLPGDKDAFRLAWFATQSRFEFGPIPDQLVQLTFNNGTASPGLYKRRYFLHLWDGQPAFVHQYKGKTEDFEGLNRVHIPLGNRGISTSPDRDCNFFSSASCRIDSSYEVVAVAEESTIITGLRRFNAKQSRWG